jgi:hypothetical protein
MERIEGSLSQLAEGAQGAAPDERKALGDAARELDRQKLSDRMRKAARAEAQQGEGKEGAQGQQRAAAREGEDIAKQLEKLAERLGAATGHSEESRRLSEQLARNRELREKLNEVDRQLADMRRNDGQRSPSGDNQQGQQQGQQGSQQQGQQQDGQQPGQQGQQQGQQGESQDTQRGGQPQQQHGERSPSSQGQQGQSGQDGPGSGGRGGEVQRADEAGRPWDQARELVDELRREDGMGRNTPEMSRFNPGLSAPGTEAWKQDFAKWEELKEQMEIALEKAETSLASQLREQESKDRLNAGATQAVPDAYRRLVDKYYKALASRKKP